RRESRPVVAIGPATGARTAHHEFSAPRRKLFARRAPAARAARRSSISFPEMTMPSSLDVDRVAPSQLPESVFLWGAPRSGKSGFAGSLYGLGLSDRATARWTAQPRDDLDEHTHEELKRAYRDLQQLGYRKTDVRTPAPLRLIVRKRTKAREVDAIALSLVDPAGEWVTDAGHRASFDGVDVHRRAAQSNGLIWVVQAREQPAA